MEMKPYASSGKESIEVYEAVAGLNPGYCIHFWSVMFTKGEAFFSCCFVPVIVFNF